MAQEPMELLQLQEPVDITSPPVDLHPASLSRPPDFTLRAFRPLACHQDRRRCNGWMWELQQCIAVPRGERCFKRVKATGSWDKKKNRRILFPRFPLQESDIRQLFLTLVSDGIISVLLARWWWKCCRFERRCREARLQREWCGVITELV